MKDTQNNKSILYDMASAAKVFPTFSGKHDEDVTTWLRDTKLIAKTLNMSEETHRQMIIISLRDKALSWASNFLETQINSSLTDLLINIEKRFSNQITIEQTLQSVLNTQQCKTRSTFTQLLAQSTKLHTKKILNSQSLMKLIVARSPSDIKSFLWQSTTEETTWENFIKIAEEAASISFTEQNDSTPTEFTLNTNTQNFSVNKRENTFRNRYQRGFTHQSRAPQRFTEHLPFNCELHGPGYHSTSRCRGIEYLRKKRTLANLEVKSDKAEPSEDDTIRNKESSAYISSTNCLRTNPFKVEFILQNKKMIGLIDTGADISLIHKNDLPDDIIIFPTKLGVRVANYNEIEICGQAQNIPILINGKQFSWSPIVTQSKITSPIIGIDIITHDLSIIIDHIRSNLTLNSLYTICNLSHSPEEEMKDRFKDLFKTEITQLNRCNQGEHHIMTTKEMPITQPIHRFSIHQEQQIDNEIDKMLRSGVIVESNSPWRAAVVPISKPDGSLRLCQDYRPLNNITIKDAYPVPRIDYIIDSLQKAKYFSVLDAISGYYQIPMSKDSAEKTAFSWRNGHYEFTSMPFGLCNAPATFQRIMDKIFRKESGKFVIPYLDDIIVFSNNLSEHHKHLESVFWKIKSSGISLNPKKCKLFRTEIKILGYIITKGLVKIDPDKSQDIINHKQPENISELRSFLGMCNCARDFVPNFAQFESPLSDLLKGESKKSKKMISWTPDKITAFKNLKMAVSTHTSRNQPDFDLPFILITDASSIAISAILAQKDVHGRLKMIYTFSKKFDKSQQNYSVTDKELLAVIKGVEKFRPYLIGRKFTLHTDHKALQFLWTTKNFNARLLRWALKLQEYSFDVVHIPGENNIADSLSRQVNLAECKNIPDLTKRRKILEELHVELGHASRYNMIYNLRPRKMWRGLTREIDDLINSCTVCQMAAPAPIYTRNIPILTNRPYDIVEADLIGPLQTHDSIKKYILICIDHFSKWIETKVINDKSETTVWEAVKQIWIDKHGIPTMFYSDMGREFDNKTIQKNSKLLGFDWIYNSPHNHQAVGCVERANKTFFSKLQKLSEFGEFSWENHMETATNACNYSFNRAINSSPFCFLKKQFPQLKIDTKYNMQPTNFIINNQTNLDFIGSKKHQKYIENDIIKGKRRTLPNVKIGDDVFIYKPDNSRKMAPNWLPGYKIIDKISDTSFIVSNDHHCLKVNNKFLKISKLAEGVS
ncbi:pol polyprotein [Pseudoloma neurophilia]|uniref:RNA-directed DNA polymerase n=1 Tax=Pseudoloma neurophilia TaxID=146866 RepID=A0A0R0LVL6_9MICR|nr:pol polyprotein [Pseudoloma neurophilia]